MKRLLIIVATLAVSACGAPRDSVREFVANAGAGQHGTIPALPESPQYAHASYEGFDLRDPFAAPPKPEVTQPREPRRDPLERYSLETLRMVGTLQKGGSMIAVVRGPDGLLHQVRTGNRMGQNLGRITAITEATITLVEPVLESTEQTTREVVINLVDAT